MTNLGKVLIVDDDAVSNYISAHMLRLMNVTEQVSVAKNGYEALKLVKEASFDLVLLDMKMPLMDGFEFMEALQKLQKSSGITAPDVIILTTSEDPMDKARAMQYPIKGYLVKPLTQEQVNRLVDLVAEGAE